MSSTHRKELERDRPTRRRHLDLSAGALAGKGLTQGCGDGYAAVAGIRLERSNELVLERRTIPVSHPDETADAGAISFRRSNDLGGRELQLEERNSPLELSLLLEEVVKGRIVPEVAVLTRFAQTCTEVASRLGTQEVELFTALRVATRGHQHGLTRGDYLAHVHSFPCRCRARTLACALAGRHGAKAPFRHLSELEAAGLRQVLLPVTPVTMSAPIAFVAEAEDGAEAVEKALAEDVHLAILDVSMPRMTGIQAAAELHKRKPELRLLMLSMHDSEQFLFEALKAGASGYVLKSGADNDIVEACRAAMRGDSFLYPSAITKLVRDYVERGGRGEEQFDVLTPRELEVLKLIAEAHTSKEIAQLLFISVKTVERHRQNILDKLGMRDRVELTRYAIRRGLIQP
jgi:DNA-binding NarL/FixJ family response regulator